MPIVIAKWPNGTFSVIKAPLGFSMSTLFWELDNEADPGDATLYLLKQDKDGWSHMTFDWNHDDFVQQEGAEDDGTRVLLTQNSGRLDTHSGRLKKLKWPRNILRNAYRAMFAERPPESVDRKLSEMTADQIKDLPSEPVQTYTVDEVRSMEPFSGVYFAFNEDGSCHYVGEAKDVTTRVSKNREEIGSRRIGLISCKPHERKRIESYFVGLLDPPGNGASTHRMKKKEKEAK